MELQKNLYLVYRNRYLICSSMSLNYPLEFFIVRKRYVTYYQENCLVVSRLFQNGDKYLGTICCIGIGYCGFVSRKIQFISNTLLSCFRIAVYDYFHFGTNTTCFWASVTLTRKMTRLFGRIRGYSAPLILVEGVHLNPY